jgi:methyl coenzyme M reductase gamma subunit
MYLRDDELPRILLARQPGVELTPVHPTPHEAAKRACVRPSA